jgi:hypothetical protein
MMSRILLRLLTWTAALLLLGGLLLGAYLIHDRVQRERAAEGSGDKVDVPKRVENGVIKLGARLAESHGIKDEPARQISWYPRVPVYGRVVPNPRATAEVRSPFAGTLRADSVSPWPAPGKIVQPGQVLGRVDIRVGPQERLDLQMKLNEARLKQQGAEEVLQVHEARVARLQKAGASEIVSRKELDDALVQFTDARTQLSTARSAVAVWQKALDTIDKRQGTPDAAWSEVLTAPAAGEVTELAGQPGMAVEAGGLVARLVDFHRPLVRLDLPPEVLAAGPPPQVELTAGSPVPVAHGLTQPLPSAPAPTPVVADRVGPAPQVDVASQFTGYWYEIRPNANPDSAAGVGPEHRVGWRPGLFVRASLPLVDAPPQQMVSVPRTAVLFHQGRALVYVRITPGRYERREVRLLNLEGDRWVLAAGIAADESVVSRQAQVLLSEEFRGDVDND